MNILSRMSRVITFRMPSAPGWKVQYNMNDHNFTMFRFNEVKQQWNGEYGEWLTLPSLSEIERVAYEKLQLESLAWKHDLATDSADPDFTDLFPSY